MLSDKLNSLERVFDAAIAGAENRRGLVIMDMASARNFQFVLSMAAKDAQRLEAAAISPVAKAPTALPDNVAVFRPRRPATTVPPTTAIPDGAA